MYKWIAKIAMSNGMILLETIESKYGTADEVINELLSGNNDHFHGIYDPKKDNYVYFRVGHVSFIELALVTE